MIRPVLLLTCIVLLFSQRVFILGNYVRGVSKSHQNFYSSESGAFYCLDRSKKIPYSYVNDDYCDCDDGSDEPGTPACPNGLFVCRNQEFRESTILSRDVYDGICNCCDGSDEKPGFCPNFCKELANKEREERLIQYKVIKTAHEKVKAFLDDRATFEKGINTKIPLLHIQIRNLKLMADENKAKKEDLEKQFEAEKARFLPEWKVEKYREQASSIFDIIDTNTDGQLDGSEVTKSKLVEMYNFTTLTEHISARQTVKKELFIDLWLKNEKKDSDGPVFDDDMAEEEVTDTTGMPNEDYEDDGFDEGEDDDQLTADDDYYYDEDGLKHKRKKTEHELEDSPNEHKKTLSAGGKHKSPSYGKHQETISQLIHRTEQSFMHTLSHPTSPQIQAFQVKVQELSQNLETFENQLKMSQIELGHLEQYSTIDFGPDMQFASLFGSCFSRQFSHYTYKVCPFYYGHQITTYNTTTNIGEWKGWSLDAAPYTTMLYEGGESCYDRKSRSLKVILECGDTPSLESVMELQHCEYVAHLKTPASCWELPLPHMHDDL